MVIETKQTRTHTNVHTYLYSHAQQQQTNKQTVRYKIQDTTCILWSVQISAAEKVPKPQQQEQEKEQEHGHLAEYK